MPVLGVPWEFHVYYICKAIRCNDFFQGGMKEIGNDIMLFRSILVSSGVRICGIDCMDLRNDG